MLLLMGKLLCGVWLGTASRGDLHSRTLLVQVISISYHLALLRNFGSLTYPLCVVMAGPKHAFKLAIIL